jgi:hypothetical protein
LKQGKELEPEAFYWQARLYHQRGEARVALWYYKRYLELLPKGDGRAAKVKTYIAQCGQAHRLASPRIEGLLTPWAAPLNTQYDEWLLLANPRFPKLGFFSSNRPDHLGQMAWRIWQVERDARGQWSAAQPLGQRYNRGAQWLSSFLDGAYQLALMGAEGLQVDNFDLEDTLALALPWMAWGAANVYAFDDSLVLFSALGPETYGGRDLYYAYLDRQGHWSKPQNLGPAVNSRYDEEAPFLAANGRSLFYSAFRPEGYGGYDFYRADFSDSCLCWLPSVHLGMPLSSYGEDLFFRLSANGLSADFSSARAEGLGGFDLYSMYFRLPWPEAQSGVGARHFLASIWGEGIKEDLGLGADQVLQRCMRLPSLQGAGKVDLLLAPVYYDALGREFEDNLPISAAVQRVGRQCSGLRLSLDAHCEAGGTDPYRDVFLSLQQAELLARRWLKLGFVAEQLELRGHGGQYPLRGQADLHRRVDLGGWLDLACGLRLYRQADFSLLAEEGGTYRQWLGQQEGLGYRLLVTETLGFYDHPWLRRQAFLRLERSFKGQAIRYCVGFAREHQALRSLLLEARAQGFEGARIEVYLNDRLLSLEEARALRGRFADLDLFLGE